MATKKQDYGNDSISSLKGADRVRKRPGVIFGLGGWGRRTTGVFFEPHNNQPRGRGGPRPGHHCDAVQ